MPGYLDALNAKFPIAFRTEAFRDNQRVVLPGDTAFATLFPLLKCLKDECGFDFLSDVAAFATANQHHERLASGVGALQRAVEAVGSLLASLGTKVDAERIPLHANMVLECMSELAVAHLLLEGAVLAHAAQTQLAKNHPDQAFYSGKLYAADYFAHYVLPGVHARIASIMVGDRSPLDIPEEAFAST